MDFFELAKKMAEVLLDKNSQSEDLKRWREENEENDMLFQRIIKDENRQNYHSRISSFDAEEGWKLFTERRKKKNIRRILSISRLAAAIVLPVGLACAIFLFMNSESKEQSVLADSNHMEMTGYSKMNSASLVLSDGRHIDLDQIDGFKKSEKGGVMLRGEGNHLTYHQESQIPNDSIVYNEIRVDDGAEFQLKLSDGTVVHLNSQSYLRYPVLFTKGSRMVELKGEAYFDVAKDSARPFIIRTDNYDVTVLGTAFNISAYQNANASHVTLERGSVQISGDKIKPALLKPSEQFFLDKNTKFSMVRHVDISYYTAWKNGMLRFRDEKLEDIAMALSRWYGIKVQYEDPEVKDYRFGFNVERYARVEDVIKLFDINGKVKIALEDNVLKISKGNRK